MKKIDSKWEKIKSSKFNIKAYPAHADFYNTVRNLINSKTKLNKLLKERNNPVTKDVEAECSGKQSEDEIEIPTQEKIIAQNLTSSQQQITSKSSKTLKNEDEANDLGS